MPPSEAPKGGDRLADASDTKSPLVKPDGWLEDDRMLRVHFYTLKHPCSPEQRSPWWLRAFWWPRPTFSHCSVEWGPFVHNMTIEEGTGFHHADEWHEKNPPQLTLVVPVYVDFRDAAELVAHFEHAGVQKWKVFLWWSRLSRRRVPTTCASLVAAWLKDGSATKPTANAHIVAHIMLRNYPVATPDELFDNLIKYWNVQFEVIEYAKHT